ncbi:MAG: hypothetical protein SOW01_08735 [Mediterranea sp.]|nr:hypothetical protein [Mediterranea sp.]
MPNGCILCGILAKHYAAGCITPQDVIPSMASLRYLQKYREANRSNG